MLRHAGVVVVEGATCHVSAGRRLGEGRCRYSNVASTGRGVLPPCNGRAQVSNFPCVPPPAGASFWCHCDMWHTGGRRTHLGQFQIDAVWRTLHTVRKGANSVSRSAEQITTMECRMESIPFQPTLSVRCLCGCASECVACDSCATRHVASYAARPSCSSLLPRKRPITITAVVSKLCIERDTLR